MPEDSARTTGEVHALPEHLQHFEPVGLLQKRWVQNVLPWISSLAAHAAIVVLAAAMVVVVTSQSPQPLHMEQVVIPQAIAAQSSPNVPNVGAASVDVLEAADPDAGGSNSAAAGLPLDAATNTSALGAAIAPAAINARGNLFGMNDGFPGSGEGGDGSNRALRIGPPGTGGRGPGGPIFGPPLAAKRVVFVCDASGSMTNKFATLKEQLQLTISKMQIPQSFDVIFFQNSGAIAFSRDFVHQDVLAIARTDFKRRAVEFMENVTVGQTSDPMEALRLAFARKPDLIYLLTDGDFPDNDAVIAGVRKLNQPDANGRLVKINTIAFFNDSDDPGEIRQTLQKMADENQGMFKEVTEKQVEEEASR